MSDQGGECVAIYRIVQIEQRKLRRGRWNEIFAQNCWKSRL